MGSYAYTLPLKDGRVGSPRLELDFVDVWPANRAFRPMVNQLAYDVSELALVTYLLARALDRPIVSVPVVLMQQSAYRMLLCRTDSPLRDARDLAGKTIAVRAYTQTTGVWLRGELAWLVQAAAPGPAPADGVEANRAALAILARYAHEQGITPRAVPPEELFAAV